METGDTCALCLKYVQGKDMAVLDETILGKLEFLKIDFDQSAEESNSVCKECEEKIENAFDFKSSLVNTEICLLPYVSDDKTQKVNLRIVIEKDSSDMSMCNTSAQKEVCRLCKKIVDAIAVISLPKIFKDNNIVEVFQGHIPEIDVEVTEKPVVCETCQKSLASFSRLLASWSIVANGMNNLDADEDEDMTEHLKEQFEVVRVKEETNDDLSDSNTTSTTSTLEINDSAKIVKKTKKRKFSTVFIKMESDSNEIVSVMQKKMKKEDCEVDVTVEDDLQLKNEEVEIKDEDGLQTKQEIGDILETNNGQGTFNTRQIVLTRMKIKAAENSRLYRERHREAINQRRRDNRQRKKNSPQLQTLSNIHNVNEIEQISQAISDSQLSSNSHAERQRKYYAKHKEEINKRKRDNRLKQNISKSIPATGAERSRKYRERNKQKINELRKNRRKRQQNVQRVIQSVTKIA